MRALLERLRRLAGHNDRSVAFEAERSAISSATQSPLSPALQRHLNGMASGRIPAYTLGTTVEGNFPAGIPRTTLAGEGHGLVLGGSGAGKSRVIAGLIQSHVRHLIQRARQGQVRVHGGLWVIDHKSELVELTLKLIRDELAELPEEERTRFLEKFVLFNPFDEGKLLPLQVLSPEPGVAPETQAYDVMSLVSAMGGDGLGVLQDGLLYHALLLGIVAGLNLVEVSTLLANPLELIATAERSAHPEVREYFRAGLRLSASSVGGVLARLRRVLRLPLMRRMLTASTCVSFYELLRDYLFFVDLGSPPLGCEDLGKFLAQFVNLKLSSAVFRRRQEEARHPVMVVVDEFQEGLANGSADRYERLLSLARSRGISLTLVSQSLAASAKVSSTLPSIVATNTLVQILFRASSQDARSLSHLLPVTGRRPRAAPAPWEPAHRTPFVSGGEEVDALVNEVSSLPQRTFYLWHRGIGSRAILVRAAEVHPRPDAAATASIEQRLRTSPLHLGPEPRFRVLTDTPEPPADTTAGPPPRRRPRRR